MSTTIESHGGSTRSVRERRESLGLSQSELAERAGLTVHGLRKIEQGKVLPRHGTLLLLAIALGLEPYELDPGRRAAR